MSNSLLLSSSPAAMLRTNLTTATALAATTTAATQSGESYEDYFDPRFPRWLSLVLLVVGLFGNTLSLIVFLGKNMRKITIYTPDPCKFRLMLSREFAWNFENPVVDIASMPSNPISCLFLLFFK